MSVERPHSPSKKELGTALFLACFGGALEGCRKMDEAHDRPTPAVIQEAQAHGTPRTLQDLIHRTLPPSERTPNHGLEFSTLTIDGESGTDADETLAERAVRLSVEGYRVENIETTTGRSHRIIIPENTATVEGFLHHPVTIDYNWTRTDLLNAAVPTTNPDRAAAIMGQRTVAIPGTETLPIGESSQVLIHTSTNIQTTLGQMFYSLASIPIRDQLAQRVTAARATRQQQGVQSPIQCGNLVPPGNTSRIYCTMSAKNAVRIVVDGINVTNADGGLVRVELVYHSLP